MIKHVNLILSFLITCTSALQAQFVYDTINETIVGPGTKLIEVNELTQPWAIQILEVDLNNPYLFVETAKANDKLFGLEKTSSMAERKSTEGHKVIGAINGDFFYGGGKPVNAQVAGGELVRSPIPRSTVGFTIDNEAIIQIPTFSGSVYAKGNQHQLNNVNDVRSVNNFILYNPFMGEHTQTNIYGNEVICSAVSQWLVNDTVWLKAEEVLFEAGSTPIPEGSVVLSGHGTAAAFIEDYIAIGDTFGIKINLGDTSKVLRSLVGGYPQIIKDGENYVDQGYANEGGPDHTYDRHPRTAVGYSEDTTKLYLITVDGRQAHSVGMTLPELADFMLQVNCFHGVNLDGGGSTTMVANQEIVNSPSDYNGERAVSNALMIVSTAPQGELNNIKIQPNEINIRYGYFQELKIAGYDEHFNVIEIDTAAVIYELSSNLGIIQNHTLYAYHDTGSGYLKVTYNNLTDSIPVTVHPVESMSLSPAEISTDSIIPVEFKAITTNIDTKEYTIPANLVNWSIDDETVGNISETGVFSGSQNGTAIITASIGNVSAESSVQVEIYSETILIDAMEDAASWQISSSSLDSVLLKNSVAHTEGAGCLEIFYRFEYANRTPYIVLQKNIEIPGIPDSLWLDTKYYNGNEHRITLNLHNENSTYNPSYGQLLNHSMFYAEGFALKTLDLEDYPYCFEKMTIEIWKNANWEIGQIISGWIFLDNFRASYPGHSPISEPVSIKNVASNAQVAIFPNPAKQRINIRAENTIMQAYLFDLNGRMLKQKFYHTNNSQVIFDIDKIPPGTYLLKVIDTQTIYHTKLIKTK